MYHPEVAGRRLYQLAEADRVNPKLDPRLRFEPKDHSVARCDEMAAHLEGLIDAESGDLKRKLTIDEQTWIRHEKFRCMADFSYWMRYAKINDLTGHLTRFIPNIAQRMVLQQWGEMERAELAIMMIQLKARQLGVTTLTELAIAHRAQFYPDVNAVVASASPGQSDKMATMMDLCWRSQPWFLVPRRTRDAARVIEFGDQNSAVSIQHGAQFNGIARGSTPTVVHLSELASYDNAEDLVEASLLRAIHETPWVFVILESTAEGLYGYWPKKWAEAKAKWPKGQSRFCPLFLPWFIGTDLYPTAGWLKKQPVPAGWIPPDMILAHAKRAETYVSINPLLQDMLGYRWKMPVEQMWFYHSEYESAKDNNLVNKFLSEMPADENEAFQTTQQSAFRPEVIQFYRNETAQRAPWGVFGLRGRVDEIPAHLQPAKMLIDTNRPSIPINCRWSPQLQTSFELVPLKYESLGDDNDNKLFIYEPPSSEFEYGYGCDTAYGTGGDASALEVVRKATLYAGPKQVAEYASKYVSGLDLWPMALAVGTLYSPAGKQCRAVIECRGVGDVVQHELRKRGWQSFHPWYLIDSKTIDVKKVHKLGWFTNQSRREVLMTWILSALNGQWLDISSPYIVKEMASLSGDEGEQNFRADYGGHDDLIMALGMVLVSLHELSRISMKGQTVLKPSWVKTDAVDEDDDPVYDPGWQGRDTGANGAVKRYLRSVGAYHGPGSRPLARRLGR